MNREELFKIISNLNHQQSDVGRNNTSGGKETMTRYMLRNWPRITYAVVIIISIIVGEAIYYVGLWLRVPFLLLALLIIVVGSLIGYQYSRLDS